MYSWGARFDLWNRTWLLPMFFSVKRLIQGFWTSLSCYRIRSPIFPTTLHSSAEAEHHEWALTFKFLTVLSFVLALTLFPSDNSACKSPLLQVIMFFFVIIWWSGNFLLCLKVCFASPKQRTYQSIYTTHITKKSTGQNTVSRCQDLKAR